MTDFKVDLRGRTMSFPINIVDSPNPSVAIVQAHDHTVAMTMPATFLEGMDPDNGMLMVITLVQAKPREPEPSGSKLIKPPSLILPN